MTELELREILDRRVQDGLGYWFLSVLFIGLPLAAFGYGQWVMQWMIFGPALLFFTVLFSLWVIGLFIVTFLR